MTKEEKQKLSKEEIYKLFDKGQIDFKEFDELRKTLPENKEDKLNSKLKPEKKKEKKTNIFGCLGMIVYVLFVGWFCGQLMNGNPVSEFVGTALGFGFIVLGVYLFRDK